MVDEYPNEEIVKFCGAGCKNYALQLRPANEPNGPTREVMKCKGISLDFRTRQKLNFEAFEDHVGNFCDYGPELRLDPIPVYFYFLYINIQIIVTIFYMYYKNYYHLDQVL